MTKEEVITILTTSLCSENLKDVLAQCYNLAVVSNQFIILSKDEVGGSNLSVEHYFKGCSQRAKNPNGVAVNTPGFLASFENFGSHQGLLALIIVKLDEAQQFSLWLSSEQEVIGCMLHSDVYSAD